MEVIALTSTVYLLSIDSSFLSKLLALRENVNVTYVQGAVYIDNSFTVSSS